MPSFTHRLRIDRAPVRAGPELGHAGVTGLVRPVQEEATVGGEVGVKGDAEQALLGAGLHHGRHVEHDASLVAPQAQHPSGLFEHPQCGWVARCCTDVGRSVQAAGDLLEVEVMSDRLSRLGGAGTGHVGTARQNKQEEPHGPGGDAQGTHTA